MRWAGAADAFLSVQTAHKHNTRMIEEYTPLRILAQYPPNIWAKSLQWPEFSDEMRSICVRLWGWSLLG